MSTRLTLRAGGVKPAWTIRKVNGSPFPILPQTVVHELYIIDRDSYEDTNGNLQRTILGQKDKFLLTFPAMNQTTMNEILARVPAGAFTVEFEDYYDPSIIRSAKFMRGDTKKEPYMLKSGQGTNKYVYNAGFSFNLIAYNVRSL